MPNAADVTTFLNSLPHIRDVRPVRLTLPALTAKEKPKPEKFHEVYEGAIYTREEDRPAIYLLGQPPSSYKFKVRLHGDVWEQKYVYRLPDDDHDWYVACHSDEKRLVPEYARLGPFFILGYWPHDHPGFDGERIDHHGPMRRRLNVQREWLDDPPPLPPQPVRPPSLCSQCGVSEATEFVHPQTMQATKRKGWCKHCWESQRLRAIQPRYRNYGGSAGSDSFEGSPGQENAIRRLEDQ
jgi:hypothetical protein